MFRFCTTCAGLLVLAATAAGAAYGASTPSPTSTASPTPEAGVWLSGISGFAWPIVALIAIIALHKPFGEFLRAVGGRATKLSLFQVAVELTPASEFQAPAALATEIRDATFFYVNSDSSKSLFDNLDLSQPGQYLTIDLGDRARPRWLTSRLFIFTVMLERMRGVRCVVFTERTPTEERAYVGYALSSEVRWRLAMAYPWLEQHFALAYAEATIYQGVDPGSFEPQGFEITSETGRMGVAHANLIATKFLNGLQLLDPPEVSPNQWTALHPQNVVYEHAKWIDPQRLSRILKDSLRKDEISASPDMAPEEIVRQILRRDGPFVARVSDTKRLTNLIDRNDILEKIASREAQIFAQS
jgi:hypothetical protein